MAKGCEKLAFLIPFLLWFVLGWREKTEWDRRWVQTHLFEDIRHFWLSPHHKMSDGNGTDEIWTRKPKGRSPVWKNFVAPKNEKDGRVACVHCQKDGTNTIFAASTATGNLWRHLKVDHNIEETPKGIIFLHWGYILTETRSSFKGWSFKI